MRWVHMECLKHWRATSVNPRSFYECEQCRFQYQFGQGAEQRFLLARLLASSAAVHGLSLLLLAALVFAAGFVGKCFDPSLGWLDVFRCFNINHLLTGATTTGLGSLLGWATSMGGIGGGGGWRMIIGDGWHGALGDRGGGRDVVSMILLGIMVLAGLAVAFYWIYERIEEVARKTTRMAQSVVLDVQGGEDVGEAQGQGEQGEQGEQGGQGEQGEQEQAHAPREGGASSREAPPQPRRSTSRRRMRPTEQQAAAPPGEEEERNAQRQRPQRRAAGRNYEPLD